MLSFANQLDWVDGQKEEMCSLITQWANINSHSHNMRGLEATATLIREAFTKLGGDLIEQRLRPQQIVNPRGEIDEIPLGNMLVLRKRMEARVRVLLGIHMDTVYPPDHPFQRVTRPDKNTLIGPGVIDAKGGIVVMLKALEALERSPVAQTIGWDVYLNPDEEVGSPSSGNLLSNLAQGHVLGLVFEPALPDGRVVSERKGTGRFSVVIRGRAAHAGRAPDEGRHAINELVNFIAQVNQLQEDHHGIFINVGKVEGGGPVNVIPDLAIGHMGVRVSTAMDQRIVENALEGLVHNLNGKEGFSAKLHGAFLKPPKILDHATQRLLDDLRTCGDSLGQSVAWKSTAGASDGNILAAAGLPTLDSLGPCGGLIHSPDEFLDIKSLTHRAKLAALFLMRLAAGELETPMP